MVSGPAGRPAGPGSGREEAPLLFSKTGDARRTGRPENICSSAALAGKGVTPHALTQLRSLARTHARTKRIRFPGWTPPPTSDIYMSGGIYLVSRSAASDPPPGSAPQTNPKGVDPPPRKESQRSGSASPNRVRKEWIRIPPVASFGRRE